MLLALRHPRLWLVIGLDADRARGHREHRAAHQLPKHGGVNDKLEHVVGYAVLTLWFAGIYPRSRYPMIAIALFVMGVVIEWAQGAMHVGRQADLRDVYRQLRRHRRAG